MAAQSTGRYNVIVGMFVLGSLLLGVAVSFWISGGIDLRRQTDFVVRFPLSQGAAGIKPGSQVTFGGQQIGQVRKVTFVPEPGPGSTAEPVRATTTPEAAPKVPATGGGWVEVHVRAAFPFPVAENAPVYLELPLLGTLSKINIAGVGDPATVRDARNGSVELQNDEVVTGSIAPPAFLAQAGLGPNEVGKVRDMINDAAAAVAAVRGTVDRSAPRVEQTITDAAAVVGDVRTRYPEWAGAVTSSLQNIDAAAAKFPGLVDKGEGIVASAHDVMERAGGVVKRVDDLIAANRESLDEIVATTRDVVKTARDESLPVFNRAVGTFEQTLQPYRDLGVEARGFLATQLPELRRTIANFRLTSDQVKLLAAEVRTEPWRLFFQPGTKELEADLLYRAAAVYADAVSNLRGATDSLEGAIGVGTPGNPGSPVPTEELQELARGVRARMQDVQQAEQRLLDVMIKQSR